MEVSGYASAYAKSRQRNRKKVQDYLEHTDKTVVFITDRYYIKNYEEHFASPRVILLTYQTYKDAIYFSEGELRFRSQGDG